MQPPKSFALSAILMLATTQPAHARDDKQLWSNASANFKLNDNWRVAQEFTARFSNKRNGLYELEGVTLLGYDLGRSVTFAAGYVHNPQYSEGRFTLLERRARAQVTFDNLAKFGGGKVSARIRFEKRWRDNADGAALRARPYIKFARPLRGATSLTISNETYVNLRNSPFQRTEGFERMRNLIAISTAISKKISLEAGYLNQYSFVREGNDTVDHAASFSLGISL